MSLLDALIYGVRDVFYAGSTLARKSVLHFRTGLVVSEIGDKIVVDATPTTAAQPATLPIRVVSINTTIDPSIDGHVAMTLAGGTLTLPAAPTNGDSYEVSNQCTGADDTITIDANGKTIQSRGATDVLAQYESRELRFSGDLDAWIYL